MSMEFYKKYAIVLIAIVATVFLVLYVHVIQIWGMDTRELRQVYLGLALSELLLYIGWSIITAYAAVFYSLKNNVEARWKKVGLLCLCASAPWIVGYLINLA